LLFVCGIDVVDVRRFYMFASVLALVQLMLGLFFSYSVRVAGDVSTPLALLPVHFLLAIFILAFLLAGVVRGRGSAASRLALIPLTLLVVSGLVGLSISLTIQGVISIDQNLLSALGLYVHNPLGWLIAITTVVTYLRSRKA
jgi:hypothetical protein